MHVLNQDTFFPKKKNTKKNQKKTQKNKQQQQQNTTRQQGDVEAGIYLPLKLVAVSAAIKQLPIPNHKQTGK